MLAALISESLAKQARADDLQAALASQAPNVPSDELRELAELLEKYVHGLPVAIDALTAMTKEPQVGRSVSFAAGQVLLYLIDEDDLFAERELGAIGLLDDTYLVHACIAVARSAFPQIAAPAGYEPPDAHTVAVVRSLLPAGGRKLWIEPAKTSSGLPRRCFPETAKVRHLPQQSGLGCAWRRRSAR